MSKQFTDKLDEISKNLGTTIAELRKQFDADKYDWATFDARCRYEEKAACQQILAAIAEAAPTPAVKPPKGQPHYLEAIGWQQGYKQGIADFLKALGIEKGEE